MLNQPRSTQRYLSRARDGEVLLVERMIELATKYGSYGYRRITALLQREGFEVNHKRKDHAWSYDFVATRTKDGTFTDFDVD